MRRVLKILLLSSVVVLLAAGCSKSGPQQNNQPVSAYKLQFTEVVDGSKTNQPQTQFIAGQSALEILQATHQIQTKDYGSMGKLVTSIDGITPDSKHYWEFFVNGKSSNVGAGDYQLQNGDQIEWKLSAVNSSGQ
jgi:hypothetical protein